MTRYVQEAVTFLREHPQILAPLGIALVVGVINDAFFGENFAAAILVGIITAYLSSVFLRAFYCVHSGEEWDWSSIADFINPRFIRLLVAGLLSAMAIIGGLVLLVVPGIYLMIKLTFYQYAIIFDDDAIRPSFERSWEMTRGIWWPLFGLFMLFMIPTMIIMPIAGLFGTLLSFPLMVCFTATLTVWYLDIRESQTATDAVPGELIG